MNSSSVGGQCVLLLTYMYLSHNIINIIIGERSNDEDILGFCRLILSTLVLSKEWIFMHFYCLRVDLVTLKDWRSIY